MDSKSLEALAGGKLRGIAEGYERASLIQPSHQAFIAKQRTKDAMKQLKKKSRKQKTSRKPQNNK